MKLIPDDQPRKDGRWVCTPEFPYPKGADGTWQHPQAKHVGDRDYPDGQSYDRFHCPVCGHSFYVEVAQ